MLQVSINLVRALFHLGMTNMRITITFDEFTRSLNLTFDDQKCIISEHVKKNLSKFFERDVDLHIESHYIELLDSEEY